MHDHHCRRCGQTKPKGEFYHRAGRPLASCKQCCAALAAAAKARRNAWRAEVTAMLDRAAARSRLSQIVLAEIDLEEITP